MPSTVLGTAQKVRERTSNSAFMELTVVQEMESVQTNMYQVFISLIKGKQVKRDLLELEGGDWWAKLLFY